MSKIKELQDLIKGDEINAINGLLSPYAKQKAFFAKVIKLIGFLEEEPKPQKTTRRRATPKKAEE